MGNFQLIRHNLIKMFAMWLTYIFMQHQTMNNSQHAIHAINSQQNNITQISCYQNQLAQCKQNNSSN